MVATQWRPPRVGTLGMFIIDTFKYIDAETGADLGDGGRGEALGGGGLYFAIGARAWLPPQDIAMVIDRGSDFKMEYQEVLDQYARSSASSSIGSDSDTPSVSPLWKFRDRSNALTTKAVNVYRGDLRGFEYLTPKLRLDPPDLVDASTGRLPEWVHCICSPDRASTICDQIEQLDLQSYGRKRVTKICWEPIPDSAVPANLEECLKVMDRIDVLSPNHEEAASFLSVSTEVTAIPAGPLTPDEAQRIRSVHLRELAHGFLQRFTGSKCPLIVIRCGAAGSVALLPLPTNHSPSSSSSSPVAAPPPAIQASIPAWHSFLPSASDKVVDVTGGGNSFLGGLIASFLLDRRPIDPSALQPWLTTALQRAAVSASFAIEQLGLPTLRLEAQGKSEEWNMTTVEERLRRYSSSS